MSQLWKKGHIAKVCHSNKQHRPSADVRKPRKRTGNSNWVEDESENSDSDLPVLKVSGTVQLDLNLKHACR